METKQKTVKKYQVVLDDNDSLDTTVFPENDELMTKVEAKELANTLKQIHIDTPNVKVYIKNTGNNKLQLVK